jgi:hypothetical protein
VNTDAWSRMILELDTTLDARQRQKWLDKLDLFIEELGALAPGKATREDQALVSNRMRLELSQRPPPRA